MDPVVLDLSETAECTAGCAAFLERWQRFWDEHSAAPVAILVCDGYLEALRPKSRAMVRQARRRYEFREFEIGSHAQDVEAVNHSKAQTTYGPVYGWTAGPVFPLPDYLPGCEIHSESWYGGFDPDGVLRGYVRLIRMGTLAVLHSIFRHAERSTGVLNGVLAHAAEHSGVEHISYHTMDVASHTGRPAFKRHTGFQATQVSVTR